MAADARIRNNINIIGTGERTLVFAHGFGCDQEMWRYIVPGFADSYRIVLFDYVGSGGSQLEHYDAGKYGSLHGYAQDVLDVAETLDLQNAIFIGHSVSGMIGMLASIREAGRFSRLVMLGASPRYLNDPPAYYGGFDQRDIDELLQMMQMNFIGWASYMAPLVMRNAERRELAAELERSFCSRDPHIARQFAEVTFLADCRDRLEQATIPSLLLQCSDDSVAPVEVGRYLHAHLKNSTLKLMSAKGHYPHLSQPEETIRHIKEYLANAQ